VWSWVRKRLALPSADRENRFVTKVNDAIAACLDSFLRTNAELGHFTTRPVARDALRIPRLLGYDRYDILAVSYGTRVALDMLRLASRDARAVVLDSTLPPQVTSWDYSDVAAASFLDRVLALCAADASCAAAYPDLSDRFDRLASRLDSVPQIVSVSVPFDAEPVKLWLDGTTLRRAINETTYESALIAALPEAIAAAEAGDLDALRPVLEGYVIGVWLYETTSLNRVPYACGEFLLSDPASRPGLADRIMWWRYASTDAAWCEDLGLDAAGPAFVRPVYADVPTLLLAGELDWVTPPAWADDAATTLRNGRVVRLQGLGHAAAFANDCAATIVGAFLDDPAGWTDPPCMADLPPPFVIAP
jgi:pimeloyl-ACP methyl ester carboxylesterase